MRNYHKKLINDEDRNSLTDEVVDALLGYRIKDMETILNEILWHISDRYLLAYHNTIITEDEFSENIKSIRSRAFSTDKFSSVNSYKKKCINSLKKLSVGESIKIKDRTYDTVKRTWIWRAERPTDFKYVIESIDYNTQKVRRVK